MDNNQSWCGCNGNAPLNAPVLLTHILTILFLWVLLKYGNEGLITSNWQAAQNCWRYRDCQSDCSPIKFKLDCVSKIGDDPASQSWKTAQVTARLLLVESKIAANIPPGGCWCRLHGVVSLLRHFKKILPFWKWVTKSIPGSIPGWAHNLKFFSLTEFIEFFPS